MRNLAWLLVAMAGIAACTAQRHPLDDFTVVDATTILAAPAPRMSKIYPPQTTERGRYLVTLLGCGACHTDGALIGAARDDRLLAGSHVGIAHSNPLLTKRPGVVFPPNLTPDVDTGLGAVPDDRIRSAIRSGLGRHGKRGLRVMPTAAYAQITDADVEAIVAYLRSVEPVAHVVPMAVPQGTKTDELYVHFGVYMNRMP